MSDAPSPAFIAHVSRAQRPLHVFILTLVWYPADADDVLQETNLVLWQKAAEYDESRPFLPWAMRIAHFQSLAWLKRSKRGRMRLDDDILAAIAVECEHDSEEHDARRLALGSCLQHLAPQHRDLIVRRYQPEGNVTQLAAERGSSPNALSEQLRRIRALLLTCIERNAGRAEA